MGDRCAEKITKRYDVIRYDARCYFNVRSIYHTEPKTKKGERSCSAVLMQYRLVMDRQTDRHRARSAYISTVEIGPQPKLA